MARHEPSAGGRVEPRKGIGRATDENARAVAAVMRAMLPPEVWGHAESVRDVRLGAGGGHAEGVTLPALPAVAHGPGLPEVPAPAGRALQRLPAERRGGGRIDEGRSAMNPMSAALERLRFAVRTLPGVLARVTEAESEQRPSPERWSKKEVLGHLI